MFVGFESLRLRKVNTPKVCCTKKCGGRSTVMANGQRVHGTVIEAGEIKKETKLRCMRKETLQPGGRTSVRINGVRRRHAQ